MKHVYSRREFTLMTVAGAFAARRIFGEPDKSSEPLVRFGFVTDLHFADINPFKGRGPSSRYFRESAHKLDEAVALFNERKVDFAIELGDLKDKTRGHDDTLAQLEKIETSFARFNGPRYHVAGNHDFDCITPEEFFSRTPNDGIVTKTGWYSFERGGVKFIVLNACFTSKMEQYDRSNPWTDSNIPPEEIDWFKKELSAAKRHVVVFCHQRLDDSAERHHLVKNAKAVREIIERSGKVRAVITGHQHSGGKCMWKGVPYYTLRAMVCDTGKEANSFAEGAIYPSGAFTVTGWRNASSWEQ